MEYEGLSWQSFSTETCTKISSLQQAQNLGRGIRGKGVILEEEVPSYTPGFFDCLPLGMMLYKFLDHFEFLKSERWLL